MFSSIFILLFSVAALFYWLRLSVTAILERKTWTDEARRMAAVNRLEFPQVRDALSRAAGWEQYGDMVMALRHDFLALSYLLRFAATVDVGSYSREERLLVADFHLMRILYSIGRQFSSERLARYAISQMARVLEHFAGVMGQRMSSFEMEIMKA